MRGAERRTASTSIPAARAAAHNAPSVPPEGPVASLQRTPATSSSWAAGSTGEQVPLAGVHVATTSVEPAVKVPVLSVARTVTEPRASTAGSDRTIAPRLAIRRVPPARANATTAGSDSGMAATARLMPVTTVSSHGLPCSRPRTHHDYAAAGHQQRQPSPERGEPSLQWRGRGRVLVQHPGDASQLRRRAGGHHHRAARAVHDQRPGVQHRRPFGDRRTPGHGGCARRSDGADSPVSRASSTCSSWHSSTRASAPTTSPSATSRTSPGTSSAAAARRGTPHAPPCRSARPRS